MSFSAWLKLVVFLHGFSGFTYSLYVSFGYVLCMNFGLVIALLLIRFFMMLLQALVIDSG